MSLLLDALKHASEQRLDNSRGAAWEANVSALPQKTDGTQATEIKLVDQAQPTQYIEQAFVEHDDFDAEQTMDFDWDELNQDESQSKPATPPVKPRFETVASRWPISKKVLFSTIILLCVAGIEAYWSLSQHASNLHLQLSAADFHTHTSTNSTAAEEPVDIDYSSAHPIRSPRPLLMPTRQATDQVTVKRQTNQQAIEQTPPARRNPGVATRALRISIAKKAANQRVDQLATKAYRSYRSGHIDTARQLYDQALTLAPHHRDSLLGRAAIHRHDRQPQAAVELYQILLKRYPRDHNAIAGLSSAIDTTGQKGLTSEIQGLLRENPQSVPLNYSVGRLLLRQQRWQRAQQHLFKAHVGEPNNPNIAYNLAVSLDQLGKPQAAAQYYRIALQLAEAQGARFDRDAVRQRLSALQ